MLRRLFAFMIRLYPRTFRESFEEELNQVFATALETARLRGRGAVIGLIFRELRDFPWAVLRAHQAEKAWLMKLSTGLTFIKSFVLVFLLVPFVIACLCNFARWNYWFVPPSLSSLTADFATVEHIGYYDLEPDDGGYYAINGAADMYEHDADIARLPQWARSQEVTTITPLDEITLTHIEAAIRQANWQVEFLTGWNNFTYREPVGYIAQGYDHAGQPLALISMVRVINDDHYGYYEGVFHVTESGFAPIASHNYNYDFAGLEFAQWPFWFASALMLWTLVLFASQMTHRLYRRVMVAA